MLVFNTLYHQTTTASLFPSGQWLACRNTLYYQSNHCLLSFLQVHGWLVEAPKLLCLNIVAISYSICVKQGRELEISARYLHQSSCIQVQ